MEALKAGSKESRGEAAPGRKKNEYEMTQQQLADIYFSSGDKPNRDAPMIVRIVEKPSWTNTIPWIIASWPR